MAAGLLGLWCSSSLGVLGVDDASADAVGAYGDWCGVCSLALVGLGPWCLWLMLRYMPPRYGLGFLSGEGSLVTTDLRKEKGNLVTGWETGSPPGIT
jgi:hypothetical protein